MTTLPAAANGLETLASGYGLIEGPRVDARDRLYFSDVRGGGVFCRSPDGAISTVVPKRRGVGGIALHADGGLVISGRNVCHVRDGATRVLLERPDVGGFNDLYTDAQGAVYVGSLRSNPFGDDAGEKTGDLWRIAPDGATDILYGDVALTNGIGLSPDGRKLYHSDSVPGHVLVHDLAPDGQVSHRRVFARVVGGAPDGLAVDEEGGVWVAVYGGGRVARFGPDGRLRTELPVPATAVTSLCFGGADRRDLYIVTADNAADPERRGTIFRTRSPVPGLPAPLARV